ncbi:MAG TPA: CU044_5270 family protein [Catenuloplanes sp.]|jgi:hypothetical protein
MKSDLSMLQEFGESLNPTVDGPPARVRHRVLNGMRGPVQRRRSLSRPTGVRLAWRIGAPAGVAAAVAAALVIAQLATIAGGSPAPPDRDAQGTATMGAATMGAAPPATSAAPAPPGARQVLLLAARHAAATPALAARPNQFLFIDSVEVQSSTELKEDRDGAVVPGRTTVSGPQRTRTWLSVDGTRDGLVIQEPAPPSGQRRPTRTNIDGCKNGRRAETIDRPESSPKVPCTPEPAYRPDAVPTDPERLLAHLFKLAAAKPTLVAVDGRMERFIRLSADHRAFQELAELLYKNHSPAVQEAAFRAAERITGVEVRRGVADASGRAGVAVTHTEAGARHELVFDPATYAYLGHNIIAAELDLAGAEIVNGKSGKLNGSVVSYGSARPKPGDVIYKSALLRIAIVDRAGQRP